MTVSSENKVDWVYRIFDRRAVSIKAKDEKVRKIVVMDLSTNLPFGLVVPENVSLKGVEVEKSYLAAFKVYTARTIKNVASEYVEFFEVLDVDQAAEDFIKAYWVYPQLVKFELVEVEPL